MNLKLKWELFEIDFHTLNYLGLDVILNDVDTDEPELDTVQSVAIWDASVLNALSLSISLLPYRLAEMQNRTETLYAVEQGKIEPASLYRKHKRALVVRKFL